MEFLDCCLIMPEKTSQLLGGRSFQACFGIHTHVPFLLQQLLGMAMFPLCQAGRYGHISLGLNFSKMAKGWIFSARQQERQKRQKRQLLLALLAIQ